MAKAAEENNYRTSIILMCLGNFFFWAAMYVYVPVLSIYAKHLGASLSLVGMVVGAYGFTQFILRIPVGVLSDRTGRRKPFVVGGFAVGVVGCLGMGLAPNAWMLAIFRGVVGIACTGWVAAAVLFSSYFPPKRVTQAMGLLSFAGTSGNLLSLLVGGKLAEELGWQAPFLVGAVLAGIGALCIVGVKDVRVSRPTTSSLGRVGALVRVPGLAAVWATGAFLQHNLFSTVYGFTPLYAEGLGATKTQLGLLLTIALAPYVLFSLSVATISGRLGEKRTLALGLAVVSLTTIGIPLAHGLPSLALLQFVHGAGRGLVFPSLMGLAIRGVEPRDQATAMGMYQAVYALGMFTGPSVGGMIADGLGLSGVFLSSGAITLVAIVLAVGFVPSVAALEARRALASAGKGR